MNLDLNFKIGEPYKSQSQKIRVITESWLCENGFCPNCGGPLTRYPNNRPVADFLCQKCCEDFELKSKKGALGSKITDGAYATMLRRLAEDNNPSLFVLNYSNTLRVVKNLFVVPSELFTSQAIEPRVPLSGSAHRAGWQGCNILFSAIPQIGRIDYIMGGRVRPRQSILDDWHRLSAVRSLPTGDQRGWALAVWKCIERLEKKDFSINEVYAFESALAKLYPENHHIKEKIRQQLQVLRDKGLLTFVSSGRYRLA